VYSCLFFFQLLISLILASDSSSCRSLGQTTLSECFSSSQMMPGSHSLCSSFFVTGTGFDPIVGENLGHPRNTTFLNPDNTSAIFTLPQGMFPFLMFFVPFFLLFSYYIDFRLRRLSRWRVFLRAFPFGDLEYHRCLSALPHPEIHCAFEIKRIDL
jgi:hypothetical protein